jgi:hypothetical protein
MRTLRAAAAASLVLMSFTAAPAFAAPPANDVYAGAVEVTEPLPFIYEQDTTEATTDADDAELNAACGAPATDASVWFTYTPTADRSVVVSVEKANYSAGLYVATGGPGDWQVEACGAPGVVWDAVAGVTYAILAFDYQEDGGGNGGDLILIVDQAPPPPTLDVTVNPTGTFNAKTGEATLTGTVKCDAIGQPVFDAGLEVELSQRVGRLLIRGYGGDMLECDGVTRPWNVVVTGDNGLFKGGKAASVSIAYACGDYQCSDQFIESTVQLKGAKR